MMETQRERETEREKETETERTDYKTWLLGWWLH